MVIVLFIGELRHEYDYEQGRLYNGFGTMIAKGALGFGSYHPGIKPRIRRRPRSGLQVFIFQKTFPIFGKRRFNFISDQNLKSFFFNNSSTVKEEGVKTGLNLA